MKVLCLLLIFLNLFVIFTFGQDQNEEKIWEFSGLSGFSYNQTIVSPNWQGSEQDSLNWIFKINAAAERDTKINNWLTSLNLEWGETKIDKEPAVTNADLIFLTSLSRWKIWNTINPYSEFVMDTQVTKFHNPVTYTQAAGLIWFILDKPKHNLNTRAGPALRQKFERKDNGFSSTDDPDTKEIEEFLFEVGMGNAINYHIFINEITKFITESRFFTAFNGGFDLRWESDLLFKLGNYLTADFEYLFIRDYNKFERPRTKLSKDIETRFLIIIGLSYNLFKQ